MRTRRQRLRELGTVSPVIGTLLFLGTLAAVVVVLAYRVRQLEKRNATFHK